MADFLIECGHRSVRPSIMTAVMSSSNAKFEEDQRTMFELVTQSKICLLHYGRNVPTIPS